MRKNQKGFTLWNARLRRAGKADSTGFIPMIILMIIIIAVIVWLAYSRVQGAHG